MKITEVETIHLRLPTIAQECNGTQDALLVKISTDSGLVGIGEVDSSPHVVQAIFDAPYSHTLDADCVCFYWERIRSTSSVSGRRCIAEHSTSGGGALRYMR